MRKRVLAVDDSATMRRAVSLCLENLDVEVILAVDGSDALRKIVQGLRADLVISYVHMPEMDGITLTENLRSHPAYAEIPILILTSEASDQMREKGKAAGATGWMLKPFDTDELAALVTRILARD